MDRKFPCTNCGACCSFMGNIVVQLRSESGIEFDYPTQLLKEFPFVFDRNGKCEKYESRIGCTIYKDRPTICRSDKMFDEYYSAFMTEEEYLKQYAEGCNSFMDLVGITDPEKKVQI